MKRLALQNSHLIGPPSFYKEAVLVMLPVVGQQMVSALFNFSDNLMVGLVDAPSLAGVTVANKLFFIFSGIFWGITGAGGLMLSQYHGAGDREECQRLFSLQLLTGTVVSLLFTLFLMLAPELSLRIFVRDPEIIAAGLSYVRWIRYSYLPAGISMVCMFSLRSVGQSRVPLFAGIVAICFNIFLNWVLIFGNLGAPRMNAAGAAIATLIARLVEMTFYLIWIGSKRTLFSWNVAAVRKMSRPVLKMALAKALPLTANEFLWTVGNSILFWSYAHIDESQVSALVIVEQANNLTYIIFGGMSAGVAIMVGKRLGANQFAEAKSNAWRILVFQGGLALLMSLLAFGISGIVPEYFNVSHDLRAAASRLIMIQALFYVPNVIYANVFFILRAGGDIRSAFILDAAYTWVIPIPVSLVMAVILPRFMPVGIVAAFIVVQILMNAKIFAALRFLKREHWLRNLTMI